VADGLITSEDVKAQELRHVRADKPPDAPLVGLALSGGGIRSACFGLGVLQALQKLKLFQHLDYVSTVSGGGYIGGWLQAAIANGRPRAIELEGEEPREIRFLRAYSNYLTPKLGLFSGDTWAAVGNSLRNLILNFTILSLSLLAPLYLPWLGAAIFWALVPDGSSGLSLMAVAAAFFVLAVAASIANTARPVRTDRGTKSGVAFAAQRTVYALVIVPGLIGIWLVSTVMWAWAREPGFTPGVAAEVGLYAAFFYTGIWTLGLIGGFAWRRLKDRGDLGYGSPVAALVLVLTGGVAGGLGTFLMGLATRALALTFAGGSHLWLVGLLTFPIGVGCLMLAVTAHIGLAGDAMSDETREWWGRVGGVQLLMSLLLIAVGLLALAGPHLYAMVRVQWQWLADHQSAISTVLGVVWAGLTAAGVLAGRSDQTATGRGNRLLEFAGKVAPVVFVLGYLFILAVFMHRVVPRFTIPLGGGKGYAVYSLCNVEARMRTAAAAEASIGRSLADAALDPRNDRAKWHLPCESETDEGGTADAIPGLLLVILGSGALAWLISWRVNLNEFSLHTFYRNRLVRCFLGASRKRAPHPFTGFDDDDDLPLTALAACAPQGHIRPYPIFNAAINLVAGKNLAWQERKAASFVFTPEYCGFEYRDDDDPPAEPKAAAKRTAEDEAQQQKAHDTGVVTQQATAAGVRRLSAYAKTSEHAADPTSLTMGLAIATSGAAASPNMGYHTSPTLGFLMTVFNVRLGWWLRNPRFRTVWTDPKTGVSLRELLYELLGMTTDDKKWVYLSDGGHFENLGVYELVRRRCRLIIACDAGQDGNVTFEDLGNAIERCRADFGVDIEIDLNKLRPGADRRSEWHCAIGTIRYDRLPPIRQDDPLEVPGTLLYIKTSLTGDEPADILRYAAEHPAFPHESTNDQFFDESQFESYRALGYHEAEDVLMKALNADDCGALQPGEIFTLLRQRWGKPAPAPPDAVRKYSAALDRVWTVLRTSKTLNFLDGQMFPELPALMDLPPEALPRGVARPRHLLDVNYWLPKTEAERREGFYVCVQMLQLMEDVFLDFDLDQYYDHIDNRGWMNLFQHWAWSGMLCATWAMTGSTFDPRFQRFCWTRLALRPGRASVASLEQAVHLPDPVQWREWSKAGDALGGDAPDLKAQMERWQVEAGLNFWEAELVSKYLRATGRASQKLFPIYLTVESPRRTDGNPFRFNVGYVIGDVEVKDRPAPAFTLYYMRIQNHLRKMGLARDALMALRAEMGVTLDVAEPLFDQTELDRNASDEALPTDDAVKRLRAIIRSLP